MSIHTHVDPYSPSSTSQFIGMNAVEFLPKPAWSCVVFKKLYHTHHIEISDTNYVY
jgi:hypothetical protein